MADVSDLSHLIGRAADDASPPREVSLPHIPPLDGLRAFALLLVLAVHFQLVPKVLLFEKAVFWFTGIGWSGVQLFFVLSGFLITSILLRSLGSPSYYATFYVRRTLRIFPVYYVFLITGFALLFAFQPSGESLAPAPWYLTYLQNVRMAARGGLGPPALLGPTWSLAVEEQFYLLWPLVVRTLDLRSLRRASIGIIVVAPLLRFVLCLAYRQPLSAYVLMPARMDAIAAGSLLAILHREHALAAWRGLGWPCFAVGAVILARCAIVEPGFPFLGPVHVTAGLFALTLIFASVVRLALLARPGDLAWRTLSWAPLRSIGKYSYAMYLFHPLVRELFTRAFPALADARTIPRWFGTQWIAQVLFYAAAGSVTYAVARCSWTFLEGPFLAMKERWPYGRPLRSPGAAPGPLPGGAGMR